MTSFDMALVDELRKRLDATYTEALTALEEAQGDVLRALAAIERMRAERQGAESSGELVGRAIALAKEGKLRGLRVKLGDRPLRDLPLPKGAGGAVLGAVLSSLLAQLSLDLVKAEEEEGAAEAT